MRQALIANRSVSGAATQRSSHRPLLPPRQRLSPEHITAIREAVEIVGFIGRHVALHRSGKEYAGCCPWHESKSGKSFKVYPEDGRWKCYGCNVSGDSIAFAGRFFGIGFREAVQLLAREVGIDLGTPIPAAVVESQRKRAELAAIDATIAEAAKQLLMRTRSALHRANRTRITAADRLIDIENGDRERFAGEAGIAREVVALASRDVRRLDAAYCLLAFGHTEDREQFVSDPESRDALIDEALHRGYVATDRGYRHQVGV